MKKFQKILLVILLLLTIAIMGSIRNSKFARQDASRNLLTETNLNWKKYTNNLHNFEFEYPDVYTIVREEKDWVLFKDLNIKTCSECDDPGKSITIDFKDTNNINEWLCPDGLDVCSYKFEKSSTKTIDNSKIISFTLFADITDIVGFGITNSQTAVLIKTTTAGTGSSEAQAELPKIVSTFRFVK